MREYGIVKSNGEEIVYYYDEPFANQIARAYEQGKAEGKRRVVNAVKKSVCDNGRCTRYCKYYAEEGCKLDKLAEGRK